MTKSLINWEHNRKAYVQARNPKFKSQMAIMQNHQYKSMKKISNSWRKSQVTKSINCSSINQTHLTVKVLINCNPGSKIYLKQPKTSKAKIRSVWERAKYVLTFKGRFSMITNRKNYLFWWRNRSEKVMKYQALKRLMMMNTKTVCKRVCHVAFRSRRSSILMKVQSIRRCQKKSARLSWKWAKD